MGYEREEFTPFIAFLLYFLAPMRWVELLLPVLQPWCCAVLLCPEIIDQRPRTDTSATMRQRLSFYTIEKNETRYFVLTMKTNTFPPQSEALSEDTDIVLAALRIGLKLQSAWYSKQCWSFYTGNCTFPDFCLNTTCVVTAAVDDAMVGRCHRHMQRTEESLLTMNILSVRWWHKIKPR